jgi:hypothetical protein
MLGIGQIQLMNVYEMVLVARIEERRKTYTVLQFATSGTCKSFEAVQGCIIPLSGSACEGDRGGHG